MASECFSLALRHPIAWKFDIWYHVFDDVRPNFVHQLTFAMIEFSRILSLVFDVTVVSAFQLTDRDRMGFETSFWIWFAFDLVNFNKLLFVLPLFSCVFLGGQVSWFIGCLHLCGGQNKDPWHDLLGLQLWTCWKHSSPFHC